jgi:hypothetical protein
VKNNLGGQDGRSCPEGMADALVFVRERRPTLARCFGAETMDSEERVLLRGNVRFLVAIDLTRCYAFLREQF